MSIICDGTEEWCIAREDIEVVRNMDLTPTVGCSDDNEVIQVSVVVYTNWGGFTRETYSMIPGGIADDGSGVLLSDETEELFPFQCGVMF